MSHHEQAPARPSQANLRQQRIAIRTAEAGRGGSGCNPGKSSRDFSFCDSGAPAWGRRKNVVGGGRNRKGPTHGWSQVGRWHFLVGCGGSSTGRLQYKRTPREPPPPPPPPAIPLSRAQSPLGLQLKGMCGMREGVHVSPLRRSSVEALPPTPPLLQLLRLCLMPIWHGPTLVVERRARSLEPVLPDLPTRPYADGGAAGSRALCARDAQSYGLGPWTSTPLRAGASECPIQWAPKAECAKASAEEALQCPWMPLKAAKHAMPPPPPPPTQQINSCCGSWVRSDFPVVPGRP